MEDFLTYERNYRSRLIRFRDRAKFKKNLAKGWHFAYNKGGFIHGIVNIAARLVYNYDMTSEYGIKFWERKMIVDNFLDTLPKRYSFLRTYSGEIARIDY